MEKYVINGKKYTQDFLSISEIIEIAEISSNATAIAGEISPLRIIQELENSGKLLDFLNVILKGKEPLKNTRIKPAILLKVVLDFFVLNEVGEIVGLIASQLPEITEILEGVIPPQNITTHKKKSTKS